MSLSADIFQSSIQSKNKHKRLKSVAVRWLGTNRENVGKQSHCVQIKFKFHNVSVYTLNIYVDCFFSFPGSQITMPCMLDIIGIIDNMYPAFCSVLPINFHLPGSSIRPYNQFHGSYFDMIFFFDQAILHTRYSCVFSFSITINPSLFFFSDNLSHFLHTRPSDQHFTDKNIFLLI